MPAQRVEFFATRSDLETVLTAIERKYQLKYVQSGLFESDALAQYSSFSDIPGLGIADRGDSNSECEFLVANKGAIVRARAVPQHRGGTRFAVDQMVNPHTIAFRPGGRFDASAIIAGRVATISHSAESRELFKAFAGGIRHEFRKIGSYLVGNEAGKLLDEGCRLTTGVGSPPSYDLRR